MALVDTRKEEMKMKKERARAMKPKTFVRRMWDGIKGLAGGGAGGGSAARPMVLPPNEGGKRV